MANNDKRGDPLTGPTRQDVMRLWRKHGGGQHGPRVETVTMPLDQFHDFIADVLALVPTAPPASQALAEPVPQPRPSEDDIVQLLFSVQTGAARLRPTAAKIMDLFAAPPPAEAQARIEALEAERDEAREIARVFAEHWPYGERADRDAALRIALCAVPSPTARAPLSGSTSKPPMTMKVDQDWLRRHTETDPDVDVEAWGSTPKPARVEITEEMVERGALAMERYLETTEHGLALDGMANACLTAALTTAPAKDGEG